MEHINVKDRKDHGGSNGRSGCEFSQPREHPQLLGPNWIIEGEDPERYEKVLAEVGAAAQPIDFIDWLLVKDIGDLTWEIQRSHLQCERLMRTARLFSLQTVIFSILYSENGSPYDVKHDPTASRIVAKWAEGDIKGVKRVEELLAQAGLSMADVDLESLTAESVELERLDEAMNALLDVAMRSCGKSSGGAPAGRSWCGARARKSS
jgi:hypothetical protein